MKKILCLLVLLVLVVGCQLDKNPFLGTWRSDLALFGWNPGDYWTLEFYDDDTFIEGGRIYSVDCLSYAGYYSYTDTVLKFTYKGGDEWYITYAFYEEDIMIWYEPINITFNRQ